MRALTGKIGVTPPAAGWDELPAKLVVESDECSHEGLFANSLANESLGEHYFAEIDWGRKNSYRTVRTYYPIDDTRKYHTIGLWATQWYRHYNPKGGIHRWLDTCNNDRLPAIISHMVSRFEEIYDNPDFNLNNCYVFGSRHPNEYKMIGQQMVIYNGKGDFGHHVLAISPVAPTKHINRGHMVVGDHHRPPTGGVMFEIGICFSLLESWHPWALLESIRKSCKYGAYFVMRRGRFNDPTGDKPIFPRFIEPDYPYDIATVQEFIDEIQPDAGTRVVDVSKRNDGEYHFYVEFDHENYPDWKYIDDWGDDPLGVN